MSLFSSAVGRPIFMRRCCRAIQYPAISCRVVTVYTNTARRRFTAARAARGKLPARTLDGDRGAANEGRSGGIAPQKLHYAFPHQTPVIFTYDTGDFGASLDEALKAIDLRRFPARRRRPSRKASCADRFSCYIAACRIAPSKASAAWAPASELWNPPRCASIRSAPSRSLTARTATARA